MFGLIVFGVSGLYLWFMFVVVRFAWRRGKRDNGSVLRGLLFAALGFLAVYLPVFWNHIPVLLEHRARCASDAGFTVYVTPEQWVAQNQELVKGLRGIDLDRTTKVQELGPYASRNEFFGGALAIESKGETVRRFTVNFGRQETRLVDIRTGKLLYVDVSHSVGSQEWARPWLSHKCPGRPEGSMWPSIQYSVKLRELIK